MMIDRIMWRETIKDLPQSELAAVVQQLVEQLGGVAEDTLNKILLNRSNGSNNTQLHASVVEKSNDCMLKCNEDVNAEQVKMLEESADEEAGGARKARKFDISR